ncbi:MAG: CocE/NonD family hydrolase [Chloroflexota bacterium]|nr:CocE/NonD family hydrolase [Chloroflexota bacterium]
MAEQLDLSVSVEFNVAATMRDGTVLRANVYRPASAGTWPVLLTRLPYGKDLPGGTTSLDPVQTARRGYIVAVQDTRGRLASEGEWYPYRSDGLDGVDTIQWAADLPGSSGRVGMYGSSYYGYTQWLAAVQQPPALKAMIPNITWNDPLNGGSFRGGALELGKLANWNLMMGLNVLTRRHRGERAVMKSSIVSLVCDMDALGIEGYQSLPLNDFGPLKRNEVAPSFFDTMQHPMDPAYFEPVTIRGKHERVTVPSLNVGGWYDIFLQDTIGNFTTMRRQGATPEARQSKLLLGPWSHGGVINPIGERNFGLSATAGFIDLQSDFLSVQLRWFDHWLKGIDTGMLREAPIKLFVMGANTWRAEQEWPLARAVETRYYLHSNGHANTWRGDGSLSVEPPATESLDQYAYDPANPVITRGGALLMSPEYPAGPFDQRVTESRTDVLVYTSGILEHDIEVTGPVTVHLWATSSAPDTDFVARLVDVYPDGYALNLTDGILRARYRDFARGEAPTLIEPGQAYAYDIDLWATSNIFKAGHRMRLDITSSNFPRWDRNPNTSHDLGVDAEGMVAHQAILHDSAHLSYMTLPVVPGDA